LFFDASRETSRYYKASSLILTQRRKFRCSPARPCVDIMEVVHRVAYTD